MKSAVYNGKNSINIANKELPEINDGEIILEVKAVGVCPTDVKAYFNGSSSIKPPITLGHEVSGIVFKSKTEKFKPGDRVNVAADNPCMKCDRCKRGLHNMCRNMVSLGVHIDGGYSEYMKVPKQFLDNDMVLMLNKNTSFLEGTFIEPVAVSINALSLVSPRKDDVALVIGDGPNALIHVQLLKSYYGVKTVIVSGLIPERLEMARKLGAEITVNVKEDPDYLKSLAIFPDIIDITIGNEKALGQALSLFDAGTRMVIFGGSIVDTTIPITMNRVHYNQITVTGSTGTSLTHYLEAAQLVNKGTLDLKSLISRTFPLDNIIDAFDYSRNMKGIKGAITF